MLSRVLLQTYLRVCICGISLSHGRGKKTNKSVVRARARARTRFPPAPFHHFSVSLHRLLFCTDERARTRRVGGAEKKTTESLSSEVPPPSPTITDRTLESARARREAKWNLRTRRKRRGKTTILLFFFYLRIYYVTTSALTRPALRGNALYNIYREYSRGRESERGRWVEEETDERRDEEEY